MSNSITFLLNGKKYRTDIHITLFDLLYYASNKPGLIVFEHNSNIIQRDKWSHIRINNDDRIEIITIVGGG